MSSSGLVTQSFGYSTNLELHVGRRLDQQRQAHRPRTRATTCWRRISGSSPLSAIFNPGGSESGTMSGSASASGSDWSSYDYTQNSTLGTDGWWNAPSGSGSASGGASGSFTYSGAGSYTDDQGFGTGSLSGSMSESGGETYNQSYSTSATLSAGATAWSQSGSDNETDTATFQYGYSGSGSGTAGESGTGDALNINGSGSGSGSQTYAYSGTLGPDGWSGTVDNTGSTALDDSFQYTDNTDSSKSLSGDPGNTTSTTNSGTTVTYTNPQTPWNYTMPTGIAETANLSDGIATPALWASFGYVSDGGGAPAVPVVYYGADNIYEIGVFGTPALPAGVPGSVGAYDAVNSLVAQSLAPASVDAVWGMAFTPAAALKTGYAAGNLGGATAVTKLLGTGAIFGRNNAASLVPATDAALLMDYGTNGVGAALNAPIYDDNVNEVEQEACFAAGTPVLMADGTMKPIETIKVGDMVRSTADFDPEGPMGAKRVEAVFHNPPHALMELHVVGAYERHREVQVASAGSVGIGFSAASSWASPALAARSEFSIRVTPNHRFYVRERGWVQARDLEIGDRFQSHNGEGVIERCLQTGIDSHSHVEPVFNVRVADTHTYFVGSENVECTVLVHNDYTGEGQFDAGKGQPLGNVE